jgi:hypothetical protein
MDNLNTEKFAIGEATGYDNSGINPNPPSDTSLEDASNITEAEEAFNDEDSGSVSSNNLLLFGGLLLALFLFRKKL